jgi:hypothetical protein
MVRRRHAGAKGQREFQADANAFIRAIDAYGAALASVGRRREAVECYLELIEIDSSDTLSAGNAIAKLIGSENAFALPNKRYGGAGR